MHETSGREEITELVKNKKREAMLEFVEEKENSERDITEKCKESKLFYKYVNSWIKQKVGIIKLNVASEEYEKTKEQT